ncbi:oligosaccharide biosynthesis protein Alg14 like protein [Meredithblackwellia eburnea MCA 4105]
MSSAPPGVPQTTALHLAIFLGSGGHTAEMIRILAGVDWQRYSVRTYLISSGDSLSEHKALELEKSIQSGSFTILRIPRARKVHQSYITSPFSTLHSLAYCLWIISLKPLLNVGSKSKPVFADLVLMNGPGSCVPIAYSAFGSRVLGLPSPKLVYIESLARTRKLSLSAKLVRPVVNRFFVQWESLREALEGTGVKSNEKERKLRWKAKVEFEGWFV